MTQEAKYKVLIIDDEDDIIGLLTLHLKMKNYQVISAIDGVKGLQVAEAERPDIILLDVMMPGIDGFEVCKRLKEKPVTVDIPIIFLTARNQADDRVKGLMSGADDYMIKPFDFDELELRVRRSLKNSKPKHMHSDIVVEDMEGMSKKLAVWYKDNKPFDLFMVELSFDERKTNPLDVLKDFNLSLMLTLREKNPAKSLLGKISPKMLYLFISTDDLESFAKLLIDNFKKNALQIAHLKIKIRPNVMSIFHSPEELFEKLNAPMT